jgi:hypothetical protein
VRGRLPELAHHRDDDAVIARGHAAGLRLHKFKRNADLPRVSRARRHAHDTRYPTLVGPVYAGSSRACAAWQNGASTVVRMPRRAVRQ